MDKGYLLVGLGNPGIAYEQTRHNLGFLVIEYIAKKFGFSFRRVKSVHGLLALGVIAGKKVWLLKPETYMNSSGESVRACCAYCALPLERVCIVCDDIYLSLGRMKMRVSGGDGGHNGLKSISTHLGTQAYSRLRLGVGEPREKVLLADHVLSSFTEEERREIPSIVEKAATVLICMIEEGMVMAVQKASTGQEKLRGEEDGEKGKNKLI